MVRSLKLVTKFAMIVKYTVIKLKHLHCCTFYSI